MGWRVGLRLAARHGIALDRAAYAGRLGRGAIAARSVVLLFPQTYMNRSGASVAAAVRGLGVADPARALLLVYDDLDLPLGRLRMRGRGSAGGQRGMQSVIDALGRDDLPRLRFGIDRPPPSVDPVSWVLEAFSQEQEPLVADAVERAADAVEAFATRGLDAAMRAANVAADEGGSSPSVAGPRTGS